MGRRSSLEAETEEKATVTGWAEFLWQISMLFGMASLAAMFVGLADPEVVAVINISMFFLSSALEIILEGSV